MFVVKESISQERDSSILSGFPTKANFEFWHNTHLNKHRDFETKAFWELFSCEGFHNLNEIFRLKDDLDLDEQNYQNYLISNIVILRSNVFSSSFFLPKVKIEVQSGNGVLNRLVACIKCMELACWVFHCHFGPLLLP